MASLFKFEDYIDLDNQENDLFSTEDLSAEEAKSPTWSSASPPGTPTDTKGCVSLADYNDNKSFPPLSWTISDRVCSIDDPIFSLPQDVFLKQDWLESTPPFRLSHSPSLMLSADDPALPALPGLYENVALSPVCDHEDDGGATTKTLVPASSPKRQPAGATENDQALADIEPSNLLLTNDEPSTSLDKKSKRKADVLEPVQKNRNDGDNQLLQGRHKRKKTRRQKLYCICQKPDTGEAMVQCDQCSKWYHCACMSLDPKKAASLVTWKCNTCSRKPTATVKGTSTPSSLSSNKPPRRSLRNATKKQTSSDVKLV